MVGETPPPIGYTSDVHTSLLEPLLLFKQVPYWLGVVTILVTMLLSVAYAWSFAILGAAFYAAVMVVTAGDPDRPRILWRLVRRFRRYYGTR
jgi:hypothetical protein